MALQSLAGMGFYHPYVPPIGWPPGYQTTTTFAATGDKVAFMGRYWNKDHATKNIRRICFRFGAVTKAGGSGLTVSLQDVSLSSGPPIQPDETQDQTVAVANGDASFTANGWYRSGALSADRSTAVGDLIAVVWEYDGSGRLGADTVTIAGMTMTGASDVYHRPQVGVKTGGTWALFTAWPNVVFEHDDGTFGTIAGGFVASALNSHAFKQDTGVADEYALEFKVPFACSVDGFWVTHLGAATADYDVVLYSGTTSLASSTVDMNAQRAASGAGVLYGSFSSEIDLDANTTYRLAVKPTQTTATVTIYSFDVSDANHLTTHPLGVNGTLTTRLDAGAWGATTATRRPQMGVRISRLDDGAGGAGGAINRALLPSGVSALG
jgi:hypothetical protein